MYEVAKKMATVLVFFIVDLPIRWKITRSYVHAVWARYSISYENLLFHE